MPHCVLEYSGNVLEKRDFTSFFQGLHQLLVHSGLFGLSDIKSRVVCCREFRVGDGDPSLSFIHLSLYILSGRAREVRQALADRLLAFLKEEFAESCKPLNCEMTVDVREMDRETYRKLPAVPRNGKPG
jgi:5-carboxymethyl-2-hydroxymuconate isomerase